MQRRDFINSATVGMLGGLAFQVQCVGPKNAAYGGTKDAEPAAESQPTRDKGRSRVAAIAMHSEMGDPHRNLDRVEHWAEKACKQGAQFAVFPEECITGSMNKSRLNKEQALRIAKEADQLAVERLERISRKLGMTLVVGTIEPYRDRFRNSALIVGPEGYLTTYSKLHLPNPTELDWFVPGDTLPVIRSQGWTFGVGICYDNRFPEIFRAAASAGAEFFVLAVGGSGAANLITADGDQTKQAEYHKMLTMQLAPARAVDNGMYYFYANQAGASGLARFPGLALAVDPFGNLLDEHLPTEGMTVTEIGKDTVAAARRAASCTCDELRPHIYEEPLVVHATT